MLANHLENLREVPDVEGLFCLDAEGAVLWSALPEFYPPTIFRDLGRRMLALFASLDDNYTSTKDILLKFAGSWLYIRRNEAGYLGILTKSSVKFRALRIASNLTLRSFNKKELAALARAAQPEAAPAPVAQPEPRAAATPAPAAKPAQPSAAPDPEDNWGDGGGGFSLFGKRKPKEKPPSNSQSIWGD
jgi:hypothetical protein